VEELLKEIEALIAKMSPDDRAGTGQALVFVITTIKKYKPKFSGKALLKFLSLWGVAMGTDGGDRFKAKVKERAAKVGPHVGAVFQAL